MQPVSPVRFGYVFVDQASVEKTLGSRAASDLECAVNENQEVLRTLDRYDVHFRVQGGQLPGSKEPCYEVTQVNEINEPILKQSAKPTRFFLPGGAEAAQVMQRLLVEGIDLLGQTVEALKTRDSWSNGGWH